MGMSLVLQAFDHQPKVWTNLPQYWRKIKNEKIPRLITVHAEGNMPAMSFSLKRFGNFTG